jgi:NAD(P)-dependent dehydrogenase (short-subunit alcohol dehydrogenase family)
MDVSGYAAITGAASGIGRATAIAFARAGAAGVALLDLDSDMLDSVQREIEMAILATDQPACKIVTRVLDVTDETAVTTTINHVAKSFGRIDYLVNSAGISFKHVGGSADAASDDWHRVLDVNLNGTFYVYRATARIMLRQSYLISTTDQRPLQRGTIVNISSICGVVGVPLSTAYCASKHAVIGLTRTASEDYASQGLRINAVCPGYIQTPLIKPGTVTAEFAKLKTEQWTPLRRFGTAEEVADAVVFLSSGRSTYIAGTALMVDGGYTSH